MRDRKDEALDLLSADRALYCAAFYRGLSPSAPDSWEFDRSLEVGRVPLMSGTRPRLGSGASITAK